LIAVALKLIALS